MKKKQELIFKAPINDLINIADKGKLFKKLFIQFDYGKYEFSLPSNIISKVIDYIILARSFQENDLYNYETANNLHEIDIDLNDLMRYIEEGINSFFSLKIKYNKKINRKQKNEIETKEVNKKDSQYYKSQYPFYHVQNPLPSWPRKPIYPSSRFQTPEDYYYNHMRSSVPFEFERSNFYPQNNAQPHRFQNYHPHDEFNINHQQQYQRPYSYDIGLDYDERNILMKRLEKMHKFGQDIPPFTNQTNNDLINQFGARTSSDQFSNNGNRNSYNNYSFQDFQKNHLSEFFDPNHPSLQNPNKMTKDFNEEQNKMIELKREKYSLKKTLKELETKFESGVISEVDYFRTFKKLQKDIYSIEKKIENLKDKIDDELFRRRNYSKKKYTY
jgi:hypothetical protein